MNLTNEMIQEGNPGEQLVNSIAIRVTDEFQHPVPNVMVTFQLPGLTGGLHYNHETSSQFEVVTNSLGISEIDWILGEEEGNALDVSINETGYYAEPLLIQAIAKKTNEILLISFRWLMTNEFEFPYISPPYFIDYDGRVLESNHFLTFSDASTDEVKIEFASIAEISLIEIMKEFEIQQGIELGISGQNSKIKIYTRKGFDSQPQQYTFNCGFFIYGKDSHWRNIWPKRCMERFNYEMKHEVMHMVQYLLGVYYDMCDDWFMEGIAEEISGGAFYPITTIEQLETWLANPNFTTNPIDIQSIEDFPPPYLDTSGEYYPMFHLVLSYILSDHGLGKNYGNVKRLFQEISVRNNFKEAFQHHFGISIENLKDSLYQKLRLFLKTDKIVDKSWNLE